MGKSNSGDVIPDVDFGGTQGDEPETEGRIEPTGEDSTTAISTDPEKVAEGREWLAKQADKDGLSVAEERAKQAHDDLTAVKKAPAKKAPARKPTRPAAKEKSS